MSYKKQMRRIAREFEQQTGKLEYTTKEVARWAIENGKWRAQDTVLIKRCADDLADALREQYMTDPQGRRPRVKHALTEKKGKSQYTLWVDIRRATPSQIHLALQQRRRQVVGECKQIKTDLDSYNQNYNTGEQIDIVFDFTDDLRELDSKVTVKGTSASAPKRPSERFDDVLRQSAS